MYRVLIVDDEDTILNGLQHIIHWDDYGLEIQATAHDGLEAWAILQRQPFDILITDIRMVEMDGLTLLRRVNEAKLPVKSIVISGYDDFNYIKEALRLGIENYLLKPINEAELSATLLTILDKLDHESRQKRIYQFSADNLLDNVLFRWAEGTIEYEELTDRAALLGIDLNAVYYLPVVIHMLTEAKGALQAAGALKSRLKDAVPGADKLHVAVSPANEVILVAAGNQPIDIPAVRSALYRSLTAWQQQSHLEWYAFIGSLATGQSALPGSYAQARQLQASELFLPACSVVDCEGLSCRRQERAGSAPVRFDMLDNLLEQQDPAACRQGIEAFFAQLGAAAGLNGEDVRGILSEAFLRLFSARSRKIWREGQPKPNYAEILQLNDLDEIKTLVSEAACRLVSESRQSSGEHRPVVQKMVKHVESHFSEDISLKSLSNELHFNPSYLGQIFKQVTGQLFTEFLCNFRIEKAKQLLLQDSCKSRDVAEQVGFQNANYFANVFKSRTGVYPTAFKKINSI